MIEQLALPLALMFSDPTCSRSSRFAEAVASSREVGRSREELTAIPIFSLVAGHLDLPATITFVTEISLFYALPVASWEIGVREYEGCMRREEGKGTGERGAG